MDVHALPCPFCGSSKIFAHAIHHKDRPDYQYAGEVLCTQCLASAVSSGFTRTEEQALADALQKWNCRTPHD